MSEATDEIVDIDTAKALVLRKQGMSWSEVSKAMGVARHRVYNACRRLEVGKDSKPSVPALARIFIDAAHIAALVKVINRWWDALAPQRKVEIFAKHEDVDE